MPTSRQQQIEKWLGEQGECSVEWLAQSCRVSTMTIRRDLQALSEAGRVLRTHGGATPVEQVRFEFQFLKRLKLNEIEKQQIARRAAALVEDGQTILMDSGTTTLILARELKCRHRLTIITSSLAAASVLQNSPGMQVLLLGGYVRPESADICGGLTEMVLEHLRADTAFLGADGIDLEGYAYQQAPDLARLLSKMAAVARDTYIVADSSKIGRQALMRYGSISQWKGLITDAGLLPEHLRGLRQAAVNVILAESAKREHNAVIKRV